MNRFILLFSSLLFLQNGITCGQSIKITVLNKNSQPMPYAYILVNNKPVEVSDTMGIAIIPLNKLAINDTITVSYLGASPSKIIYDESLKKNKKHCFYLDESAYTLNEVVVTYQDIEKLFRKSTKSMPLLDYNCELDAKFYAKQSYPTREGYSVFGTMETSNDRITPTYWNWFAPPYKFITNSDTTRRWQFLNYQAHLALHTSFLTLWRWQNEKKYKAKPIYSYLGEKDNYKVFRILYSKIWFENTYYQIIFYVDKGTKYIKSVEVEALTDEPDKNGDLQRMSLKFDCEQFTNENPKKHTIYLPVNIQYCSEIINQRKFDLKISDVSIKYKKTP